LTNVVSAIHSAKNQARIKDDSPQNFDMTMTYIYQMLGITGTNLPDREKRAIIREHMMSGEFNYSNLDLKCAFTLYVKGKLDFTENHFQNLSIFFIEKVMQSYKRYSITLKQEEINRDPGRPSIEEYHRIMIDGCLYCFDEYNRSGRLYDYGNPTYEYLKTKGLINFTDDVENDAFEKAKNILKAEQLNKHMAGMAKDPLKLMMESIENNAHYLVTTKQKRVLLQMYFDNLIEFETELKEVI